MTEEITILEATTQDMAMVQAIYAHYVEHTTASLEEIPPDKTEITERWQRIVANDLPFIIAKQGDKTLGYAYATLYRPRSAYRFVVEHSIYMHPEERSKGCGALLMEEVVTRCEKKGYRQMLAVIAGKDNVASIAFHKKHGFKIVGTFEQFGFKFGKWVDTIMMQRPLGEGSTTLPQ